MRLEDIRAFERIATFGSLAETVRRHGVPKSSLSHQLMRLESELGSRLFERNGNRLLLTTEGHAFLSHARDVVRACERAEDAVKKQHVGNLAKIRIGTTDELGTNLMAPMCLRYSRQTPDISLDLVVLNKIDLFHRNTDLDCIISAGAAPEEDAKNLIHRRIARYASAIYAAPDYLKLNGTPRTPAELRTHALIENRGAGSSGVWVLSNDRERIVLHPTGRISSNDNWLSKLATVQGMGIGFFPEWFAIEEVRSDLLVPVMPEWRSDPTSVGIYYHSHRFSNPHIRALVTFLATKFPGFYRFPYREDDFDTGGIIA
jgi:DNA-binding transcriptional LysR family regulator